MPRGKIQIHGNPAEPWKTKTDRSYSARMFVGLREDFNAGKDFFMHDEQELVNIVQRVRLHQVKDPGSSFLTQRGLYKDDEKNKIIDEASIQVIIFSSGYEKKDKERFKENMIFLAECIADNMRQQTVILDLQTNGVTLEVFCVTGNKYDVTEKGIRKIKPVKKE